MIINQIFGILHMVVAIGIATKMQRRGMTLEAIWVFIAGMHLAIYTFTK